MLKTILQNNLPKVKPKKINVPWQVLKNIPKPERKKFRNGYAKNGESQINKVNRYTIIFIAGVDIKAIYTFREGLTFGINDVTRLLEKNLASAVLISSDIQPRFMVQHIIDEAVLYKIPIIIFDNLRDFVYKICGIRSAVIGISKNISPESKLSLIKENVIQIFEKCPPPIKHINYNRLRQNGSSEIQENAADVSKQENKLNNNSNREYEMEISPQIEDGRNDESTKHESENNDPKPSLYLKRESKDKRVFVPEEIEENVKSYKMEVDSTGFLAFSGSSAPEVKNKTVATNYKSLIVKRLKGDPNRNKRKIASFKRKLK